MHNINDYVRVRFTEEGWRHLVSHYDEINDGFRARGAPFREPLPPKDEGFTQLQVHELLNILQGFKTGGSHIPLTDIEFVEKS